MQSIHYSEELKVVLNESLSKPIRFGIGLIFLFSVILILLTNFVRFPETYRATVEIISNKTKFKAKRKVYLKDNIFACINVSTQTIGKLRVGQTIVFATPNVKAIISSFQDTVYVFGKLSVLGTLKVSDQKFRVALLNGPSEKSVEIIEKEEMTLFDRLFNYTTRQIK